MKTSEPKRHIKSHKGGRTTRLYARLTPEVRAKLDAILKARNMTAADWVTEKIEQDFNRSKGYHDA